MPRPPYGIDILVEPRRPDILAEEIIKLINDPARMELLGRNARKRAEEIYDIRKVTKKIEEILLGLARVGKEKKENS